MSMIDKFKNLFIGEDDEYEDEDDYYYEEPEEPIEPDYRRNSSNIENINKYSSRRQQSSNNVVNINTNVQIGVCMFTPVNLDETVEIVIQIKDRNIVVVNLESLEYDVSQRITDFLCGASYALDANVQLISEKIMIIAPINVEMTGELKDQLRANGVKFSNRR